MLEFVTQTGTGQVRRHDLHSLQLPSGRLAHKIPPSELYRELCDLGVAGIDSRCGQQALLMAYAQWQAGPEPRPPKSLEQLRNELEQVKRQHEAALALLAEDRRQLDRDRREFEAAKRKAKR